MFASQLSTLTQHATTTIAATYFDPLEQFDVLKMIDTGCCPVGVLGATNLSLLFVMNVGVLLV